jgi:hypothetical protein
MIMNNFGNCFSWIFFKETQQIILAIGMHALSKYKN